ncbi:MAG: hypothetical protein NT149_04210 [Candidatus Gottesmanbacteria bacterium]|nr:hypothetical protein [Candidatus Gottesmanbacteria bacterium]
MLNRFIEALPDRAVELMGPKIAKKLDLLGKKLAPSLQPDEVFITNAKKWRTEIEEDNYRMLRGTSLFVVRTAKEQLEDYKKDYTSLRILDKTFNIFGKPLPEYWGAIVGIPKQPSATTA